MQISRIEASYLTNVPITPPPLLHEPSRASVIIVEVETDDGIVGYGATGSGLPWSIVEFINKQAAPLLMGQDPMLTEYIWNQRFKRFNRRSIAVVYSSAKSAIDIALWDIKGKALGQPVWRLLGGAQILYLPILPLVCPLIIMNSQQKQQDTGYCKDKTSRLSLR